MASVIWQPDTAHGSIDIRIKDRTYTIEPGVAQDIPVEDFAAVLSALETIDGNLVSPTPSVTVNTTGTTTLGYQVVAYNANGDTLPSAAHNVTNSAASPNNTVTWAAAPGATGYKVIRVTVNPGLLQDVGNVLTFTDNNHAATAYTPAGAAVGQDAAPAGPPEV